MADVDPDDGPFVSPPKELTVGRSNVITFSIFDSSEFMVVAASSKVFVDAVVLQEIEVAAFQIVASHLIIVVMFLFFA